MRRKKQQIIEKDLQKKMVFLVGPRQVGKTWLAKEIAKKYNKSMYLNYDSSADRAIIETEAWLEDTNLLILDEVHKKKNWKTFLKGVYDTKPEHMHLLITGSARLDAFRQSGDSMAGRYFIHHLFPFSPSELRQLNEQAPLEKYLNRGGFPEAFLAEEDVEVDRWRKQYIDGLIREDILDFENIYSLKAMQLLLNLLRERIGSPISYSSLARDAEVAPNTIKKYLHILESLYVIFRITPMAKNIARSLLKEPKIYFYDTGMVRGSEGAKLENQVALSLLQHMVRRQDELGNETRLHYLRTRDKKEVDFCLLKDEKVQSIVEVKTSDAKPSKALVFFAKQYGWKGIQLVRHLKHERKEKSIELRKTLEFLMEL